MKNDLKITNLLNYINEKCSKNMFSWPFTYIFQTSQTRGHHFYQKGSQNFDMWWYKFQSTVYIYKFSRDGDGSWVNNYRLSLVFVWFFVKIRNLIPNLKRVPHSSNRYHDPQSPLLIRAYWQSFLLFTNIVIGARNSGILT
jgi:hypothetical protein